MTADNPRLTTVTIQYVLNEASKIAHLTLIKDGMYFTNESCNIDQIIRRDFAHNMPSGYQPCEICQPKMETLTA